MKRISTLVLAAGVAAFTATTAFAGAAEGSWYIAPEVNALWLDDGRLADDDIGYTLAFGRSFNKNWDLQLAGFASKHDRANNGSLNLRGFGLSANRVFYREGRVNPFLSFGLAEVESDESPGAEETKLSALYGVGLLIDLGPARNNGSAIQLRADLGARRRLSDNGPIPDAVDYVAGLGIQFSWGGAVTRVVADTDGDGVSDDLDRCPATPAGTAVDSTGCPLPQDDDGDGVDNDLDKCPGTPAGIKVDNTGCEIVTDHDGDGVLDETDKCPDTPKGDRVDSVGCSFIAELKLPGVVFETNSAALKPESVPVLEQVVATLKRYPQLNVEVAGHTDDRGADAYNMQLSAKRAATVLKYLQDAGVTNVLTSRGYGETQPIADNNTNAGREENRRVVLRVLN